MFPCCSSWLHSWLLKVKSLFLLFSQNRNPIYIHVFNFLYFTPFPGRSLSIKVADEVYIFRNSVPFLFFLFLFSRHPNRNNRNFLKQKGNEQQDKALMMRNLIGSRPPKCQKRCSSCPRCEAIQVPITTRSVQNRAAVIFSIAYSKGNDVSNYKPMSWKCKCGNMIFNP